MMRLLLLTAIIITTNCYAQDGMDAVFKVQKRTEIVKEPVPAKRLILFSYTYRDYPFTFKDYLPYTKGSPIGRDAFVAFSGDTMLIYTSATMYKVIDSDSLKYADPLKDFKISAKLVFSSKDTVVYCDRFYTDNTNSGEMEVFSRNKKVKMNNAVSLLCFFNDTRNCPAHNNVQLVGYDTLTVNGTAFNCLKIEAVGDKFMPGKKGVGSTVSKSRVATKVTYYLHKESLLPVLITETCGTDKNNPCNYSWQLSEILPAEK